MNLHLLKLDMNCIEKKLMHIHYVDNCCKNFEKSARNMRLFLKGQTVTTLLAPEKLFHLSLWNVRPSTWLLKCRFPRIFSVSCRTFSVRKTCRKDVSFSNPFFIFFINFFSFKKCKNKWKHSLIKKNYSRKY